MYRFMLIAMAMSMGYAMQAQTITLSDEASAACALIGSTPTSQVTITVNWGATPPVGELVEVTLVGATAISTNPVLVNPASFAPATSTTVTFTALADGSSGATITAGFRPLFGSVASTVSSSAFTIAANTCCPGNITTICRDGSDEVTLTPDAGLTSVEWYFIDDSGNETLIPASNYVDTDNDADAVANEIVVRADQEPWATYFSTDGNNQGKFYYKAFDPNACAAQLCCPVTINTEVCYDLALRKELASTLPLTDGDDVQFTITVFNQGTKTATSIAVADYIPTGLIYNGALSTATATALTTANSATANLTNNGDGTFAIDALAAGDNVTFTIGFTINTMLASLTNAAEITAFAGENGNTNNVTDGDSTPDAVDDNDGPVENDDINNLNGDEDDHDIEVLPLTQVFDLAMSKIETSTGPYLPGQTVTFTYTVYNQGTLAATDIAVTEYLPTGLGSASVNTTATWSGTAGTVAAVGVDGSFSVSALEAGETVAVEVTFTIDQTFTGTNITNNAEITAATNTLNLVDEDSDLATQGVGNANNETDNDVNDTPDNPDDQDDFDFANITIRQEVALGNFIFSDVNGNGIFEAGDGDVGIGGVTVELYAENAVPGTDAPIATTTTSTTLGEVGYYIFDELAPGNYFVYIPANQFQTGGALENFISSVPNVTVDNDVDDNVDENGLNPATPRNEDVEGIYSTVITLSLNGEPTGEAGQLTGAYAGDLDDNNVNLTVDFGFAPYVDLALDKTVSAQTQYNVGDVVTFTVTVTNEGPNPATNIAVTDDLPNGYTYQAGSISFDANGSGATIGTNEGGAPVLIWTVDQLDPSESVLLTYQAVILAPTAGVSYVNYAEITATDQYDDDSTPNNDSMNEDDDDVEEITPAQIDLNLVKTVDQAIQDVGGQVTFTITVTNESTTTAATGVAVEDIVPNGYSNIVNITNSGILSGSTITWSNLTVPANDFIQLTFMATVNAPGTGVSYVNVAQVTDADQYDTDSTPNNGADSNNSNDGNIGSQDNDGTQDAGDEDDGDDAVVTPRYLDYGDLPDATAGMNGTGTGDYATLEANGGASHVIIPELKIGAAIDNEADGQQSTNAEGDDTMGTTPDDEDGVDLNGITFKAGQTVSIPVTVTNETGMDAYLRAFIDWNDDGVFDASETVTVLVSSATGSQTILATFTIPATATPNAVVGARFRLSKDDALGANGPANEGEVEDYLVIISCPTGNCFGVQITVKDTSN